MEGNNKGLETRRIVLYLAITFGLTIAYCVLVIYPMLTGGLTGIPPLAVQLAVAAAMFFPSIGVLLTRLLTREGFHNHMLHPHIKGNLAIYLLAWFGPGVLSLLGAALYFLLFPSRFDPDCGYMATILTQAGQITAVPLWMMLLIQGVQALLLGPLLNFFTCFGEEWGWRGYLLPKLAAKLPAGALLLVSGMVWGLWHAPLTIVGHNYGLGYWGFPFTGIAAMCVFCTVLGTCLSWLTLKSGSCLPAVLAHGAVNAIAGIGMYFTADGGNPFVGPAPTGIVGGIPFLVAALLLYRFYFRKRRGEEKA